MDNKWNCEQCQRTRGSNYCHMCGTKRPNITSVQAVKLDALRKLAFRHSTIQQQKRNAGERAMLGDVLSQRRGRKLIEASEIHRELAEAVLWAHDHLSRITNEPLAKEAIDELAAELGEGDGSTSHSPNLHFLRKWYADKKGV